MNRAKFYIGISFVILIIVLGVFAAQTPSFESKKPEIMVSENIYTNAKSPISLFISDAQSGLKSVKVTLRKEANESVILFDEKNLNAQKELKLDLSLPKMAFGEKNKTYFLEVEARDNAFWGISANVAKTESLVLIDEKAPKVNILANSYQIEQGGAASVVFGASDENLESVFIQTNKGKIFKATPYVKDGFYAALIAWDAKDEEFRAYVIAKDKAGNETKERIRYYLANRKYRVSNIKLSDKFLDGKISEMANDYAQAANFDRYQKFKFINEDLRNQNEDIIHEITSAVPETMIEDFNVNLFLPLKNGAKVADFADHRFYYYNENFISESYHMGLDLASVAKAPIIANNGGEVVFADDNGIYGLNLIAYHGFGLYTLYAHCSSKEVNKSELIQNNSIIANTGVSGLALGDHLHFGVLVQGVEVRPEQWQDRKWINNNISKILNDSKKMILGQK